MSEKSSEAEEFEVIDTNFDKTIVINVNDLTVCRDVLKEMYGNKQFHDVVLVAGIDSVSVAAHRAVLSSASEYFSAMFNDDMKEKEQKKIEMKEVNGETLKSLIRYSYTGQIKITSDNIVNILAAASMFRFTSIEDECQCFLAKQMKMKRDVWLNVYIIAEKYQFSALIDETVRIVCEDFRNVIESMDFLEMDFGLMKRILMNNEICNTSEELVFEAAMKWVKYDESERKAYLGDILKMIRLPKISAPFLVEHVAPICRANNCSDLLIKTLQWHVLPETQRNGLFPAEQTADRSWPSKIIVIGGNEDKNVITMEAFCFNTNKWITTFQFKLPKEKVERTFALNENNVYIVGGNNRGLGPTVASKDICRVNLRTLQRTKLAPMLTKKTNQSTIFVGNRLYVIGGFNGAFLLTVERYNPRTNTWTNCSTMGTARSHMGVAVLKEYLYAIGGFNSTGYLESVERYSPTNNSWSSVTAMNAKRANPGVGILNDKLYVIGGQNNNGDDMQSVEFYDTATNKWTMIASLNTARNGISVAVYENAIFAIGGLIGANRSNIVERYTEDEGKWTQIESLNEPRFKCAVFVTGK